MNLFYPKHRGCYIYLKRDVTSNLPLYLASRRYDCGYRCSRQFNCLEDATVWLSSKII